MRVTKGRWRRLAHKAFGCARLLRLGCVTGLLIVVAAAPAQAPQRDLSRFKHSRWTADDGAPTAIRDIAQTPDGYLWLASAQGVYRFDGVTFELVPAPRWSAMEYASPSALTVTRRGDLWVGYAQSGGVARYRDGRFRDLHMPRPPLQVAEMIEAPDGSVWVSASDWTNRLKRFAAGRWQRLDDKLALPPGGLTSFALTHDGTFWLPLAMQDHRRSTILAYLPPGGDKVRVIAPRLSRFPALRVDAAGTLWVSDALGTRRLRDPAGRFLPPSPAIAAVPDMRFARLAFDREGGIWGSTASAGIFYIPERAVRSFVPGSAPQRFVAADGLSSDIASSVFVDREGSIWVGGALGLDRFRPANVVRAAAIPADPIDGQAIARGADGAIYVATRGTIFRATPHRPPLAVFSNPDKVTALCPGRTGGVWAARSGRIFRVAARAGSGFAPPPGGSVALSCAEDRGGRLWLASITGRLAWHDAAGWHDLGGARVAEVVEAPGGDVALRTEAGELAIVRDGHPVAVRAPSPRLRAVAMFAPGRRDLFVGGANALLRVRGTDVRLLDGRLYPWLTGLRALVQTGGGDTWLLGRDGISRVATADLDRAFDMPGIPLRRRLFDMRDGKMSTAQQAFYPGAQAAMGSDGRIWFLDRSGAVVVEPAALSRNSLPPPVLIRGLTSGGNVYRDPRTLVLPPGSRSLDIAYTATSLVVPQRVQFRYRLDGVDDGWVDPGSRRLASYANLAPGRYRFQVIAANDDGVWNRTGASLAFEIRPTFFQSWPFRLLCFAALLALIWWAYRLRLRAMAEHIRMRMAERMNERERIARELHDTLLQSVQALTLRFQLAVDAMPAGAPARPALEQAIDHAEVVIDEGRERVRDLRLFRDSDDVRGIIADILERQHFAADTDIAITVTGTPRRLDPLVLDEITRIAAEAVFNIWRHAEADRIAVAIGYHATFSLSVTDNGRGIDPAILARGGKDGHFGLFGMRERARTLRGTLTLRNMAEGGTEVALTVPGPVAYARRRPRLPARFWKL